MPNTTKKGFTIIELLTVMSIIIILLGVLVPALNKTRRYAKTVVQRGQFHEISKGLELFRNDHSENYPDSGAAGATSIGTTVGYCGAMKLCEALLGQDGMGFNPLSQFTADGIIMVGADVCDLYPFDLCTSTDPTHYGTGGDMPWLATNLQSRIKYVDAENIKAVRLQDLFTWDITANANFYPPTVTFQATTNISPYAYPNAVIGDVFLRADIKGAPRCQARAGQKAGMPVLYYKADTSKLNHDAITVPNAAVSNTNIYNFDDNYALTKLGCPWEASAPPIGASHPMAGDPTVFLKAITNTQVTSTPRPHREDSYILVSAGFDGLYGTRDDVYNFSE
ncbi:MAG: type II secretion system protein [Sedimentisphaerales bacterium]|jgi:type II secretory pathway pseudopilin PulG